MSDFVQADAIAYLNSLPAQSVDLVFGSPPYELARLYLENGKNLGIARKTEDWVAWMVEVYKASLRACRGLVAFVVAGQTKGYKWSAGPALLAADLHRAGIVLRNPPIYHRVGIPGSGSFDWLRADYEWVICATNGGRLPWSNNTAMGHPPKWAPGGAMANRLSDGTRVNQWGRVGSVSTNSRGEKPTCSRTTHRPSHKMTSKKETKRAPNGTTNGDVTHGEGYTPPAIANPGNVIFCKAGGGMGKKGTHENEAPFPEKLAEFFVRSYCPPGGLVVDPFLGSGTTAAIALRHGRKAAGCDLRQSQIDNAIKRISRETPLMLME